MMQFIGYDSIKLYCLIEILKQQQLKSLSMRLQLHDVIYRPNSFVLMLRYCVNLKAIRYKSH